MHAIIVINTYRATESFLLTLRLMPNLSSTAPNDTVKMFVTLFTPQSLFNL